MGRSRVLPITVEVFPGFHLLCVVLPVLAWKLAHFRPVVKAAGARGDATAARFVFRALRRVATGLRLVSTAPRLVSTGLRLVSTGLRLVRKWLRPTFATFGRRDAVADCHVAGHGRHDAGQRMQVAVISSNDAVPGVNVFLSRFQVAVLGTQVGA